MKVKVTLIKEDGAEIEYSRSIGALDSTNIIHSIKQELTKLQAAYIHLFVKLSSQSTKQASLGKKSRRKMGHMKFRIILFMAAFKLSWYH